ncbi:hypothetical protein [Veronia pacifica]|uniref:Uncharacterized protein n=1 Tax=Veronia pacifica TaxID=1080227 RepID=A0A1C3EBK4_9GAMM|nr:hypothetical protein [Veronia pacifica]ODA30615.1 hypothetical protein A8L45_19995 [Veronia pacifica]
MSITYPDNEKRQTRLVELGTDAQDYLFQAQTDYDTFEELLGEVNQVIADVYREANLQAPSVRKVDIFKESGVADLSDDSTVLEVSEIVADIAGLVTTAKYLVPGATRALVATGIMAEDTAKNVLREFTLPIVGREVEITTGDIAGAIIGGMVGGIAIAGIDIGFQAIEGAEAKAKLTDAIDEIYPMRTSVRLSQKKAATLLDSLRAIKTSLDAIEGIGLEISDAVIQNLITKDAAPAIEKEQAITEDTILDELKTLDHSRHSYTTDDPR